MLPGSDLREKPGSGSEILEKLDPALTFEKNRIPTSRQTPILITLKKKNMMFEPVGADQKTRILPYFENMIRILLHFENLILTIIPGNQYTEYQSSVK